MTGQTPPLTPKPPQELRTLVVRVLREAADAPETSEGIFSAIDAVLYRMGSLPCEHCGKDIRDVLNRRATDAWMADHPRGLHGPKGARPTPELRRVTLLRAAEILEEQP